MAVVGVSFFVLLSNSNLASEGRDTLGLFPRNTLINEIGGFFIIFFDVVGYDIVSLWGWVPNNYETR